MTVPDNEPSNTAHNAAGRGHLLGCYPWARCLGSRHFARSAAQAPHGSYTEAQISHSPIMDTTPDWNIETTIPTLAVPDLEIGIEYYERLGFSLDWRFPATNPTHAGLVLGSCSIMLSLCEPSERADLYFIVDDIAACHRSIREAEPWELAEEAGALAQREDCPPARACQAPPAPKATAYGLIDFSMVDPWGHHLTFGQPQVRRP